MKRFFAGILAPALVLTFSTLTLAQDKMQKEMKKEDKMTASKSEMKIGPMKSITCGPACGFMMKSHDESELIDATMKHMKKHHPEMKATKQDVMKEIKTEESNKQRRNFFLINFV